ncbi:hypothetical protein [Deinococcus kurensis]|uniref:hypothetical protein n=1 Tax=Deinococcus kurensis TaxID=2662757 RepID=UPI0012D2F514|nr:hypothetical protein [Deinococcus kurensis]
MTPHPPPGAPPPTPNPLTQRLQVLLEAHSFPPTLTELLITTAQCALHRSLHQHARAIGADAHYVPRVSADLHLERAGRLTRIPADAATADLLIDGDLLSTAALEALTFLHQSATQNANPIQAATAQAAAESALTLRLHGMHTHPWTPTWLQVHLGGPA